MPARDPFGAPTRTANSATTMTAAEYARSPYDKVEDAENAAKRGVSVAKFKQTPEAKAIDESDMSGLATPAGRF